MPEIIEQQAEVAAAPPAEGNYGEKPVPFAGTGPSDTQREAPELDESRANLVKELQENIRTDKRCWEKAIARMRHDMKFVAGKNHYPNQKIDDDRYLVNLTYRHIKQRVAAVYAKNPTPVAKLREQLRYRIWDGKPASLKQAQMILVGQVQVQDPRQYQLAQMIMQEAAQGLQRLSMLERIGKTGEILIKYFMDEHTPSFKRGMKKVVRRGKTVGVGYVVLNYKRVTGKDPSNEASLADHKQRLEYVERMKSDAQDNEIQACDAEAEMLRLTIEALTKKPDVVLREGLQFDFPSPLRVIPHAACEQLDGFIGADWVTIEHVISPERVQQVYKVDIKKGGFTPYTLRDDGTYKSSWSGADGATARPKYKDGCMALLWEHFHKPSGLMITMIDGFKDFLCEPEEPVTDLERYFPIYCYVPNEIEQEDDIFPLSDPQLLKHVQKEYNATRENLKQHRKANRPMYLAPDYAFPQSGPEDDPISTLANHKAHEIVKVSGLGKDQDPSKIVVPMQKAPIDPKAYETESIYQDSMRAVGSQEVDYGGTSGDTATEVAAGQQVRKVDDNDDVDALDMMLSDIFRDAMKVMLKEVPPEMAIKIAGPGAVWPVLTRAEIAEELTLDIQGGSSGRPNVAQEIANFERLTPLLVQIPGITPEWLAEKAVRLIEPTVDLGTAVAEGMPSIIQINAMAKAAGAGGGQPGTGDPATDPSSQGGEGADNQEQGPQRQMGPQAAFPQGQPRLSLVR